jgi:uncharacterized protein (DUF1800 family)
VQVLESRHGRRSSTSGPNEGVFWLQLSVRFGFLLKELLVYSEAVGVGERLRFSKSFLSVSAMATVLVASLISGAFAKKKEKKDAPVSQMSEQQRAVHALNRLTYGPRPGDVEQVVSIGVDKWIDQQLHPEKITDSAMDARLAPFLTLRMDTLTLARTFPSQQMVKAAAEGKMPLPSNEDERAVYQAQIEKYREKQEQKQEQIAQLTPAAQQGAADSNMPANQGEEMQSSSGAQPQAGAVAGDSAAASFAGADADQAAKRQERRQARQRADELMHLTPDQRFREFLSMGAQERQMLLSLPLPDRDQLLADFTPQQRETAVALSNPQQVVVTELRQAKLLRAIYSERQLDEVMTDFWFNHFNVFIDKGADHYLLTSYERDVIRPYALGKFKDLLVATATSPAMLFYLDNWLSIGPNSEFTLHERQRPGQVRNRESGLNENYARELMELHTLGVNGGYTQADVTQVAKVFTGWTLKQPLRGAEFIFDDRKHEPGTKIVLGHEIKDHGESEGMQVLDILAHHPATARFVSTKLAQRFVADEPPPALVERMARTFLESDGDIREVMRTMLHSPEFWSAKAYRAKVKTPLEFVASAVRATGADVQNAMPLAQNLNRMGMPLYGAQPPTGYSTKAETWVNSAALLSRMNFAITLAVGRLPGSTVDLQVILPTSDSGKSRHLQAVPAATSAEPASDADVLVAQLEKALLNGDVSQQTDATIRKQLDDPKVAQRVLDDPKRPPNMGLIAGLILGSPEFQRR